MGPAVPIIHGGVSGATGAAKIKERWGATDAHAESRSLASRPERNRGFHFNWFCFVLFLESVANYGSAA